MQIYCGSSVGVASQKPVLWVVWKRGSMMKDRVSVSHWEATITLHSAHYIKAFLLKEGRRWIAEYPQLSVKTPAVINQATSVTPKLASPRYPVTDSSYCYRAIFSSRFSPSSIGKLPTNHWASLRKHRTALNTSMSTSAEEKWLLANGNGCDIITDIVYVYIHLLWISHVNMILLIRVPPWTKATVSRICWSMTME